MSLTFTQELALETLRAKLGSEVWALITGTVHEITDFDLDQGEWVSGVGGNRAETSAEDEAAFARVVGERDYWRQQSAKLEIELKAVYSQRDDLKSEIISLNALCEQRQEEIDSLNASSRVQTLTVEDENNSDGAPDGESGSGLLPLCAQRKDQHAPDPAPSESSCKPFDPRPSKGLLIPGEPDHLELLEPGTLDQFQNRVIAQSRGGIPASQMPTEPRPVIGHQVHDIQRTIQVAELRYLPGIKHVWRASFPPNVWKRVFELAVEGAKPVTIAAETAKLGHRVPENTASAFLRDSAQRIKYLQSLDKEMFALWLSEAHRRNLIRYGVKTGGGE